MPRAAVVAVIAANALWVVDSLIALALDWFTPTTAGQVLIALQAVGVAGLAALQYVGLGAAASASRRSSARAGSPSSSKRTA